MTETRRKQLSTSTVKPSEAEDFEYLIKKLYRALNRAYTVEEAKAIIEEIYKLKAERIKKEVNIWHS
jgi:hypothetical protein